MKPRNKIEKEVVRLSESLPRISERQKEWAMKFVSQENSHRFRGKKYDISHFIVATTKSGWQVLRHYYLYARYRYKKLYSAKFYEVMEEWYKDGKYVFMARNRHMGYCVDGWCTGQAMSIKREYNNNCLDDPRNLGYDGVYYARLSKKFSYVERDKNCKYRIDDMFRALNAHSFNETLYKNDNDAFNWCLRNKFAFDKQKMDAVRVAMRHKYPFTNGAWADLVEMLLYLKKDIHNPTYVCPDDFNAMHDKICRFADSKRRKVEKRMNELAKIREEKQHLEWLQAQEERERKRKEEAKGLMSLYKRKRKKFFGIVIAENELEIKVLQSIQEFMEEGKEMHHCVFANEYYNVKKKPNCLILSAKVNGERMETIEVDLENFNIVQSRGRYNSNTEWHERILKLLNDNMYKIKNVNKIA